MSASFAVTMFVLGHGLVVAHVDNVPACEIVERQFISRGYETADGAKFYPTAASFKCLDEGGQPGAKSFNMPETSGGDTLGIPDFSGNNVFILTPPQ